MEGRRITALVGSALTTTTLRSIFDLNEITFENIVKPIMKSGAVLCSNYIQSGAQDSKSEHEQQSHVPKIDQMPT